MNGLSSEANINKNPVPSDGRKEKRESPHTQRRMEDIVSPGFLKALSESGKGFTFVPDPTLPPHSAGYTNLKTRIIYYNPVLLTGDEELGIKPWTEKQAKGFCFHEVGHHVAEVAELQDLLLNYLLEVEVPEEFSGNPKTEQRFLEAIRSHLINAIADIWLESFLSRFPHKVVKEAIKELNEAYVDLESYEDMPLPEQFLQFLLRSRYWQGSEWQKRLSKLSPEAAKAYKVVRETQALECIMDCRAFEQFFSSPKDKKRAIERKFQVYKEVFLPEYLKLMERELTRRKIKRQEKKQAVAKKEKAEANEGSQLSNSVSLSKKEIQEIINEILRDIENSAKRLPKQLAPSEEDKRRDKDITKGITRAVRERYKGGSRLREESQKAVKAEGFEAIREAMRDFYLKSQNLKRRGLAEAMQVRESSIEEWHSIREKRRDEICSFADLLAEVFLEDRRHRTVFMRREGEVVPGLEYETLAALASGQTDPDTKFRAERFPDLLELEVEFIVDTSGSMMGEPIRESVELVVVVTEGLIRIHQLLSDENLVREGEYPFRIGGTKFSVGSKRVTSLEEPITVEKLIRMIDQFSMVGGGTSESKTIEKVYNELKLHSFNVIKIIVLLSDGCGDMNAVWPIMQAVEKDKKVIFLAVSVGSTDNNSELIKTYAGGLREGLEDSNIAVIDGKNVKDVLEEVISHIEREVWKKKREL